MSEPAAPSAPVCGCGTPLDLVNMSYGFQLPDVAFAMKPAERRERLHGGRVLFTIPDLGREGGFVRTLLPVQLDHGSVEFGIWVQVDADWVTEAQRVWEAPEYMGLQAHGTIANQLQPWGLLGADAVAQPRTDNELPYIVDGDSRIQTLLALEHPREYVTAALPGLRHGC